MAFATVGDGTQLHVEETGTGTPLLFVHEFAGDHRSREPQVREFARRSAARSIASSTASGAHSRTSAPPSRRALSSLLQGDEPAAIRLC